MIDYPLIGYLSFLGIVFIITTIATKKFLIGAIVLLIFVVIGYILTILPIASIILSAIAFVGLISYYLFMRGKNQNGF